MCCTFIIEKLELSEINFLRNEVCTISIIGKSSPRKREGEDRLFKELKLNRKFLHVLQAAEKVTSCSRSLSMIYDKLFYRKMVSGELTAAAIKPNSRVLHIGCGSLPLTAIFLAGKGLQVTGIDCEKEAVTRARCLLDKYGLQDKINLQMAAGQEIVFTNYEAVWISLNVFPKHRIVKKLLNQLPAGGKIIYRNPRGWMKSVYCVIRPQGFLPSDYKIIRQPLNKQSVVLTV